MDFVVDPKLSCHLRPCTYLAENVEQDQPAHTPSLILSGLPCNTRSSLSLLSVNETLSIIPLSLSLPNK